MKKIKKNYTNFILTVIAIAMIGILFKGEKIISPAHAVSIGTLDIWDFRHGVQRIVQNCRVSGSRIIC